VREAIDVSLRFGDDPESRRSTHVRAVMEAAMKAIVVRTFPILG